MKKFLFLTGMILAMGAFQSLKAQTFSRVVTVTRTIDTMGTYYNGGFLPINFPDTFCLLYQVPQGKIFKLEFATGSYFYGNSIGLFSPIFIQINGIPLISYPNYPSNFGYGINSTVFNPSMLNSSIWLKSGDKIGFGKDINGGNPVNIKIFLSGIEYDVP